MLRDSSIKYIIAHLYFLYFSECPICKETIYRPFSRHFKRLHGYTPESARKCAYFYNLAARKSSDAVIKQKVENAKGKSTRCTECHKTVVNIHRHLKSVHDFTGDEYAKKLKECKSKAVVIREVKKEASRFACPVIGCASVVKCMNNHLNIHVVQKRITEEEKMLYLKKCQEFYFIESNVSPLKCIASLKVNEVDFTRNVISETETIASSSLHIEDFGQISEQFPEENSTAENSPDDSLVDDPDFIPGNDFKEMEVNFVQDCLDGYLKWMTSQWGCNKSDKAARNELRALNRF